MHAPSVISTFSGCGGSSLGYLKAGCHVRLAVEWDRNASSVYGANFPATPIFEDVQRLGIDAALELSGVRKGALDILDGSPPCQGFSTNSAKSHQAESVRPAGQDRRNDLYLHFARLLEGLRPKAFVMENVSGMVMGHMRLKFAEIHRTLEGCGYRVRAKLLNALYFGVAQNRKRVIFIGVRKDLAAKILEDVHPTAYSRPVTVAQALDGMSLEEQCAGSPGPKVAGLWHGVRRGERLGWGLARSAGHRGLLQVGFWSWIRVAWDRPLPSACLTRCLLHPDEPLYLSARAMARCSSFPDSFRLPPLERNAWAVVGNSVPPALMEAIALKIKKEVLDGS